MDEEMSRRIRQAIQDAVDRQRPPADSDAMKQQMLVTTLRLAGHTVNLLPNESGDDDQPVENSPADGTAEPRQAPPDQTPDGGNPLVHDGLDRVNDPTRSADEGKIRLLPFIINDPTRPADDGKRQLLPYIITDPAKPAAGGSRHSQPITVLLPDRIAPGAAMDDGLQALEPGCGSDASSSELEITPADDNGFSPLPVDPSAADAPPASPIAQDGDEVNSSALSAPGSAPLDPSPGALSFSFPPSAGGNSGDGGGDSQPSGSGGGSDDEPTPAGPPAIIAQPTAILAERLAAAVAEKALSLAQTTVETAVSDLRQEIYVSRAARNALFPR